MFLETFVKTDLPIMLIAMAVMLAMSGIFPLLFAWLRKKHITTKKYFIVCFVVNTLIFLGLSVLDIESVWGLYALTCVAGLRGKKILKNRGLLIESKNEEQEEEEPSEESKKISPRTERVIATGVELLAVTALVVVIIGMATQSRTFSYGSLTGDTYVNAYTGYGCKVDPSWTIEAAQAGKESEFEPEVSENEIRVMDANGENNGAWISLDYVKLSFFERLAMLFQSNEEVLAQEWTEKRLNQRQSDLIESGYQEASVVKETVSFLGEEWKAIKVCVKFRDVDIYLVEIMDFKLGEYCTILSCGSMGTDTTQELLDRFYTVE